MRTMFVWWRSEPVCGWALFWTRVGAVAGAIGWLCLLLAVVVIPIAAAIYHATH